MNGNGSGRALSLILAANLLLLLVAALPAQADPPGPNEISWCGGDCQALCWTFTCDSGHHYDWRAVMCVRDGSVRYDSGEPFCDDGYHCTFGACGRDKERTCNTLFTSCTMCATGYHYDSFGVCRRSCVEDKYLGDDDGFTCSWGLEPCGAPGRRVCSYHPSCRLGTSYDVDEFTCELGEYETTCGTPFTYDPKAVADGSTTTLAMVPGAYEHSPVQNDWHIGTITQVGSELRWTNKAGASWRLIPDLANGQLLTASDNPYYQYPSYRVFKLIVSNGQVLGFEFGGDGPYVKENVDVTFIVANDLEMGRDGMTLENVRNQVRHLNDVYSGKTVLRWPSASGKPWSGQQIPKPKAMVVAGDLTGYGKKAERGQFRYFYEPGQPNAVKMPVYLGLGNHDQEAEASRFYEPMQEYISERMQCGGMKTSFHGGSKNYSWDWGNLHLVQLNTWADDSQLGLSGGGAWLKADLAKVGKTRPVLLFQHYEFQNLIGGVGAWWTQAEKDQFKGMIQGYNVKGIFTGHAHTAPANGVLWNGYKEYRGWSGGHNYLGKGTGGFLLVRVSGSQMRVAFAKWVGNGSLTVQW